MGIPVRNGRKESEARDPAHPCVGLSGALLPPGVTRSGAHVERQQLHLRWVHHEQGAVAALAEVAQFEHLGCAVHQLVARCTRREMSQTNHMDVIPDPTTVS